MVATLQNKSNDVYKVELFLPSQIRNSLNWDDRLCKVGEYKWLLHQAQAQDSLSKMRDLLHLQDFLIRKKKKKLVSWCTAKYVLSIGDQQSTEKKNQACTTKYHAAHSALHILAEIMENGSTWSMEFRQLNDDDIRALHTDGWGEGTRTLSWISIAPVVDNPEMNKPQLIDGALCDSDISVVNFEFLNSITNSMVSHSCSCYEMV